MKSIAALLAASLLAVAAQAQPFPNRSVTLVVPFPPGGGTDTGGRILAEQLGKRWGQAVIVDNKGGAAGQIGADLVAKAKPDGYTLLLGNIGTQAINPSLYARMPYDPDKAFAPIALVAELPLAMTVHPGVAARDAKEFIALAKSQPGKLSYASSGAGGAPHLAAELFKDASGTFIVHVPYRGGGPATQDLMAGHVQLLFMTVLEASGNIKAGKLRALADALGPRGFLINVARGSVVDEAALVRALQNKRIAGAGLDVFGDEPNVPRELFALDNIVLLPHIASATEETRVAMAERVADNLKSFFATGRLLSAAY